MDDKWFEDYRAEHDNEREKVLQRISIRLSFLTHERKTQTDEYRQLMRQLKYLAGDDFDDLLEQFKIARVG